MLNRLFWPLFLCIISVDHCCPCIYSSEICLLEPEYSNQFRPYSNAEKTDPPRVNSGKENLRQNQDRGEEAICKNLPWYKKEISSNSDQKKTTPLTLEICYTRIDLFQVD